MTHSLIAINLSTAPLQERRTFRQTLWLVMGLLCIATGIVGIVVPLLPTTDFVLLAAFCFSRGSRKWEAWLLNHRQFGPMVREWRTSRCIPLRVKLWSSTMLFFSALISALVLPSRTAWIPPAVCLLVAAYLWSRPSKARA